MRNTFPALLTGIAIGASCATFWFVVGIAVWVAINHPGQ